MTADTVGGVFVYAAELCEALARHGIEVLLATTGPLPKPWQVARIEALHNVRFYAADRRLEWMSDPWRDLAETEAWLLDLERAFAPDVIHANSMTHGSLPSRAPRLVVVHSCVLSWWDAVRGTPAPNRFGRYRDEVARGLSNADVVVAPSAAMLAAARSHYGPLTDAKVIPNAVDPRRWTPAAKQRLVLGAGRLWDAAKGTDVLARTATRVPWPIALAGSTQPPAGTEAAVAPDVHLLGELAPEGLARWLGVAGIFAHPARYEPFGLVPLEAAHAGCALVLGDIPSLREIWGDAARFVPPGDREALEAAIRELIADDAARERAAARAKQRARRYSIGATAACYVDLYEPLTATRLGEPPCAS